MTTQLGLTLEGGAALIPDPLFRGELGAGDPMPPGPYTVGLTKCEGPDSWYETIPWTVRCGDGRAVAGHIPSLAIAEVVAAALNALPDPDKAPGQEALL